jgi:hypothetical protein
MPTKEKLKNNIIKSGDILIQSWEAHNGNKGTK